MEVECTFCFIEGSLNSREQQLKAFKELLKVIFLHDNSLPIRIEFKELGPQVEREKENFPAKFYAER